MEIYYGCAIGYSGGTNVMVRKNEKCIRAREHCFWKNPQDVTNSVKTRSQKEKQKIIWWEEMMNYLEKKNTNEKLYCSKMQREISDKVNLGETLNQLNDVSGVSSIYNRSNVNTST